MKTNENKDCFEFPLYFAKNVWGALPIQLILLPGLLNILVFSPCVKLVTHFGGFVWRRTAMVEFLTVFLSISPTFQQEELSVNVFYR